MSEITNIHLTKESFDKLVTNLQNGGLIIYNEDINPQTKLENQNPTDKELQQRVKLLYKRFLEYKENQKKLGIKKIEFNYNSFEDKIKKLQNPQPNYKTLVINAEEIMDKLEKHINIIASSINQSQKENNNQAIKDYLFDVISQLNTNTQKQIISNITEKTK